MWIKHKKVIAVIMAVVAVLAFAFTFVGCGSDRANEDKTPSVSKRARGKYAIFDDGAGNTYRVSCILGNPARTVYYEYEQGKTYRFSYTIYYSDNDEFTGEGGNWIEAPGEFNIASRLVVPAYIPGEYSIMIYTKLSNGSQESANLNVVVKEKPRLTPEVSFDPKDAIDFIPNERYVYKYDGNRHYPSALLSYNGNNIELNRDCVITMSAENEIKDPVLALQSYATNVGVYTVYYSIGDNCMKNKSDKGVYSTVSTSVIVEIVE
ncbi:MAG: hypothetical protein K2F90_02955 [Clostridiales bacterium]|nr:hypothetical protein [Clostridiales bacterium]